MNQWLEERRVIGTLPSQRKRVIFVENCSGHTPTEASLEAAEKIRTIIEFFPQNATDLLHPCDSFIIQKPYWVWQRKWEKYKMSHIRECIWKDSSRRVINPGRRFLKLAADSVAEFNRQRDLEGIKYDRKVMILTGMELNKNGNWEERQLKPELQRIINQNRDIRSKISIQWPQKVAGHPGP